ncbi:ArsB/NhaD family transporter [Paenibacillus algorifonticola]|uniref:ArsB/NhaD family transporter n=1 Tax=Paenibacillus algorifonticola TaxID=684063 RepID=UPI000A9C4F00|nr:ArsB/NhaD family transporter [Paenibacillus algorifonticola]
MISLPSIIVSLFAFLFTILLVLWRPRGLNEAIPATFGAILVLLSGTVSLTDLAHAAAF